MESIEKKIEKYAIVFNVNLIRATLNEAVEFKDYLAEAIKDFDKDIIVNLSACEHLDSTFLGVLVSSYKRLKTQSRTLVIIEPIDQSSIFLTLNSIGKIFPLYTSVKVALEDIENKKLIEKEIHELSDEKIPSDLNLESTSFKSETQPHSELPETSIRQETKEAEFETEKAMTNSIQKIPKVLADGPIKVKAAEWNLAKNEVEDKELINKSDFKISEAGTIESVEELESVEEEKSQIVIRHKRSTEESHFCGSGIKWEFGFSS
jgi:anti-anti-sigma factor